MQLFLEYIDCFTIGITGTKGKSTTSSLVAKILEDQKIDSILLGNIGIPIFDYIDKISKDKIVILELSSHQLEYITKSTNIAILLNIYEEHLDHYNSLESYINAKFNIFKYQKKDDIAIFNSNNELMNPMNFNYKSSDYEIKMEEPEGLKNLTNNKIYLKDKVVYFNDKAIYNSKSQRNLKGDHNLNNIMFALAVSNILNLNLDKTIETINNFKPLEHRIEYVGEFYKVKYYNDSIATIPESTIESIKALENVNTLLVRWK